MQKFSSNVQDKNGRAVAGASVTVLDSAGNPAAIFIGNNSSAQTNPIVTDTDGEYAFYAPNGRYSISIAAPGFIGESASDLLLYDPAEPYAPIDATIADSAASAFASKLAAADSADAAATSSAQVALVKVATQADRIQTGLDRDSAANSALSAGAAAVAALAAQNAAAASAASVNTADLVHKTGNETIAGDKAFSDLVTAPTAAPGASTKQVATTEFVTAASAAAAADLAAPSGAALMGFQGSGAGAVPRTALEKLRDTVSFRDFGAKGDGLADDTAAIQKTVDFAIANRCAIVMPAALPTQFYRIRGPIGITGALAIRGHGPRGTLIYGDGMAAGQTLLDFDCALEDTVYHLELSGLSLLSSNGLPDAMRLKNASYFLGKNVRIAEVANGIVLEGASTFSNSFEQVTLYHVGNKGVHFKNFNGGGHYDFSGCSFGAGTGVFVDDASNVSNLSFKAANFEQCVTNSLFVGGTVNGLSLSACRTEGCDGDDFLIDPSPGNIVSGLSVTGTYFTSDNLNAPPITLGGRGGKVRGFSINGNHVEYGAGGEFVRLNGDGESGAVFGNYFAQPTTRPVSAPRAGVVVYGNETSAGKCAEYWGHATWGVQEGNWTPVDVSGTGLTLSASGTYTKIGRTVFWQAAVTYPSTTSTTPAAVSLPSAVAPLSGGQGRAGAHISQTNSAIVGIEQREAGGGAWLYKAGGVRAQNAELSEKFLYLSGMYVAP